MRRRAAASLLGTALTALSCGQGPTLATDVTGVEWRLVTMQLGASAAVAVDQPGRYRLRLRTDGRADVGADCNDCGGRYMLVGSALSISHLACTLILCPPESLAGDYLALLDGPSRLAVEGERLTITSARGVLTFSR